MMSTFTANLDGYEQTHTWMLHNPGMGLVAESPDIAVARAALHRLDRPEHAVLPEGDAGGGPARRRPLRGGRGRKRLPIGVGGCPVLLSAGHAAAFHRLAG